LNKLDDIVFSYSEVLEMHGFHVDETEKAINLDIIIDFTANDRAKIYQAIYDEIQENYPEYVLDITLDIDTSD
jgi:hypothetical protein